MQRNFITDRYFRYSVRQTDATGHVIAQGMATALIVTEMTAFHQFFHKGMIARTIDGYAATKQVQATVPDMCPPGAAVLNQTQYRGGARIDRWANLFACIDHGKVCLMQSLGQKFLGFAYGQFYIFEVLGNGIHHHLRRYFATGLATQAITEHKHDSIVTFQCGDAILVDGPVT